MPLGMEVGLSPWDFVLNGDPTSSPQKGGGAPKNKNVYCGQTARWIKMALGMEVGLSPGDFVLDGDPARLPKKEPNPVAEPPIFGPCLLWPNGWMDQEVTGQLADTPTRGLPTRGLDISRTGQLAD